jgi:hypothetical protein
LELVFDGVLWDTAVITDADFLDAIRIKSLQRLRLD